MPVLQRYVEDPANLKLVMTLLKVSPTCFSCECAELHVPRCANGLRNGCRSVGGIGGTDCRDGPRIQRPLYTTLELAFLTLLNITFFMPLP
jgi:hypothetical protein